MRCGGARRRRPPNLRLQHLRPPNPRLQHLRPPNLRLQHLRPPNLRLQHLRPPRQRLQHLRPPRQRHRDASEDAPPGGRHRCGRRRHGARRCEPRSGGRSRRGDRSNGLRGPRCRAARCARGSPGLLRRPGFGACRRASGVPAAEAAPVGGDVGRRRHGVRPAHGRHRARDGMRRAAAEVVRPRGGDLRRRAVCQRASASRVDCPSNGACRRRTRRAREGRHARRGGGGADEGHGDHSAAAPLEVRQLRCDFRGSATRGEQVGAPPPAPWPPVG